MDATTKKTYVELENYLVDLRKDMKSFLESLGSKKDIFSYGASATSIVNALLLEYSESIQAYLDDNEVRQGTFSPNTSTPVLSPKILVEYDSPCVIIGSWRFADMIGKKIKALNKECIICVPNLTDGIIVIN